MGVYLLYTNNALYNQRYQEYRTVLYHRANTVLNTSL